MSSADYHRRVTTESGRLRVCSPYPAEAKALYRMTPGDFLSSCFDKLMLDPSGTRQGKRILKNAKISLYSSSVLVGRCSSHAGGSLHRLPEQGYLIDGVP